MKNGGLLTKDWFILLVFSLLFIVAWATHSKLLAHFEGLAYDLGVNMTYRSATNTDEIVLIEIDQDSLDRLGHWPWPRDKLASVLAYLAPVKTKAVGLLLPLDQAQQSTALSTINEIKDYLSNNKFPRQAAKQKRELTKLISQAEKTLNTDKQLAATLPRLKNLVLPINFVISDALSDASELPKALRGSYIKKTIVPPSSLIKPYRAISTQYPLSQFITRRARFGHSNYFVDDDGGLRKDVLLINYNESYFPSMALAIAAKSLNMKITAIEAEIGSGLSLGQLYIKTDQAMAMHGGFYDGDQQHPAFSHYSFYDVLSKAIPADTFKNKIVIIGLAAPAIEAGNATPVSAAMFAPERVANAVASILSQDYYSRPDWVEMAEIAILAFITLYLIFVLPHLGGGLAGFFGAAFFIGLLASGHYQLISEKIWIKTASPAALLFFGQLLIMTKRFACRMKLRHVIASDTEHSNRMLGLSFQDQGQLDMAMDKFRKCPPEKSVFELIYNLAVDYERKRQFAKAAAAYDYILEFNGKFRDAKERKQRALQSDNTLIIGGGVSVNSTLILEGVDHKPTLGRYEIEKELGKGAMGTVYLGRDPKINRVVAIKTLALSEEFEEKDLGEVKQRFFREAETAGRLSHPNIVTIYDAGEESDLAYIAMEYLQGKDLTHYIKGDELLPIDWIFDIGARIADALDYAHNQNIVHRDIKPANIMYHEEDDTLKVTDFGIARITAASRTKTGVILGTPSYMSPEQLKGKHIDGRSDLFSLGVTLYELLSGQQPFLGDSMAALMYQITNKKHKDIIQLVDKCPRCVKTIIDKALQKEPAKRYQTGADLKLAIESCLHKL